MAWRSGRSVSMLALGLPLVLMPIVAAQNEVFPTVATRDDAALGSILVDPSGWTLYTFTADGPEASTCSGQCAAIWPPLYVEGDVVAPADLPGSLTAFPRADGSMQAAYNLAPLHYYAADQQPGDTRGQGVGGSWFAASSGLTPASPAAPPVPATQPTTAPTVPPAAPTARPTPPIGATAAPAPTAAAAPTSAPAPAPAPPPIYIY